MPTYLYKAKDQTGRIVSGTLDAETRDSAALAVRKMGLFPSGVVELKKQNAPGLDIFGWLAQRLIHPIWTGVSPRALTIFFRQMATLLDSGMLLSEVLGSLGKNTPNGKLRQIAREAAQHVGGGGFLSEVIERYPWIFTHVQIGLIRAGESSGGLQMMVDRIACYLEQEMDIRRMMRAATLYPKFLVVALFTVPNIRILFLESPQAYLRAESELIVPKLIWFILFYIAFRFLLQFEWFRAGYDTLKISIPLVGGLIRKLSMARFSRALALLYSAGMPMAQAVQVSADAVGNFIVRRAVLRAVPFISQGVPASEALGRTRQVPPLVLDMITTGERTGNVDATLNKVSEYYEKEADSTVKTFGVTIFVVLVLAVALMIGMQVIGFYQTTVNNTMQQGQ